MFWNKKVKDPVCGMSVDPKNSISRTIAGKTYYFCAEGCANTYEKQQNASSASMESNMGSSDSGGHQGHSSHSGHNGEAHNCGCG